MPFVADHELGPLFRDILAGRLRLIAWGAGGLADFYLWRCPLPVDRYLDDGVAGLVRDAPGAATCLGRPVHPPSCLEDEDPARTVVVCQAHLGGFLDRVGAALERYGGFRYFLPTQLDQPLRRPEPSETPAVRAELARLVAGCDVRRHDVGALGRTIAALPLAEARSRRLGMLLRERRERPDALAGARPGVAVLYLERLAAGGAEHQLALLGAGLARRNWQVTLAVHRPEPPTAAPGRAFLSSHGIDYRVLEDTAAGGQGLVVGEDDPAAALLLWHLPAWLIPQTLALARALRRLRPEMVIGYLDRASLIAGMAAVLAGVPHILLSGRNANPNHFPHFFAGQTDDFRLLYRALAGVAGVRLSANSRFGAASYADWLDLPVARLPVIANGVAEGPSGTPAGADGLDSRPPRVAGVFRLSPEKRPILFVELFARLQARWPGLRGVICGDGPLAEAVRQRAVALGVDQALSLPGAVPDVAAILRDSTLLLHVAAMEGTPNVLLEAQALGLPVVSTRSGGSAEVLAPVLLPYCRAVDDADGLVEACSALLADAGLRRRLRPHLRRFVRRYHGLDRLVSETLAVVAVEEGGLCPPDPPPGA